MPNDTATHKGTDAYKVQNIISLAVDLQQMINNSKLGDIILKTADEDDVWACKAILVARSSFFKRKLTDIHMRQFELPSVTKAVLLSVLEFLYTGNVAQYPITVLNVFDVIHAARLVMLPSLEMEAMDFFKTQVLPLCGSDGPSLLSRAVDKLCPVSDTDMQKIFRPMLVNMHLSPKNVMNLKSCEALRLYLNYTRGRSIRISLSEYLRFASVLAWCAGSVSIDAYDMLLECLPLPATEERPDQLPLSACFRMSVTRYGTHTSPCVALVSNKSPYASSLTSYHSQIKRKFVFLLVYIDLFRIHSSILAKIIEPLDMISSQNLLLHVYRFQSVYSELAASLCWSFPFHNNEDLVVLEGGSVIQKLHSNGKSSIAVSSFAVTTQSRSMFEWDIIIEKGSPGGQFGIGFVSRPPAYVKPGISTSKKWLGQMSYAWCLDSRGYLFRNGKMSDEQYAPALKEGDVVRVNLDISKFACNFTVNGVNCGIKRADIPAQVWPAVAIDTPSRVRIEVVAVEDKRRLNVLLHEDLKLQY